MFSVVADTRDVLIYWGGERRCPFSLHAKKYTDGLYLCTTSGLKFLSGGKENISYTCEKQVNLFWISKLLEISSCVNITICVKKNAMFSTQLSLDQRVAGLSQDMKNLKFLLVLKGKFSIMQLSACSVHPFIEEMKNPFSFQDFAGAHFKILLDILETCAYISDAKIC